jgi:general secretion pathway protein D
VKNILLVIFLTCLGALAQDSAPPPFEPVPTNTPDANQQEKLLEAIRQAAAANSNSVVNQAPPGPAPVPPPAAPGPAPAARPSFPNPRIGLRPAATPGGTNAITPPRVTPPATVTPLPPGIGSTNAAEQLIAISPPPGATNSSLDEKYEGVINFPAADLNQVLMIYSELVGRTILRPTSLPAPTITLISKTPLTRREAKQAFDAVLALNGIATIDVGDKFVKVVPTAQAGQVGASFSKESPDRLPEMGQFVTHIIQLTYAKPSELVQALTPFASPGLQGILPIDSSQILVLRDFSENVKRMLEMIKKVDVAVPSEYISEVIPIKYALAADIASALNSLSSGGGGTTVGSAAGGGTTGGARTGYSGSRTGTGTGTGFGRTGFGNNLGGMQQGMNTPFGATTPGGTTPGAGGSSFTSRLQNILNKASVSGEIQILGQTKIIADERSNSLLIFAGREDMKMIKDIVAKLDVVLAQVLIEAVIIQVSLQNQKDIGISYLQKTPSSAGGYYSGLAAINNKNIFSRDTTGSNTAGTNTSGVLPGGFSYLAGFGNDLDVFITALASDGRAKILQRPRIQTSHAVPATLFVGQQRPYPTSSYYGGGAFGGYASIQQLQIGVTLEVTPLINPEGLVVMDIHQKIDSFEGNVTIQNVGDVPVTSSKDATAKVAVRDHDTVILGGLIETDKNSNYSGVPYLKDIPLLGYLFRSSHHEENRTELIVLIRPTVLPTPEVAALAAKSVKNEMPMIRKMEIEVQADEAKRSKALDDELKLKGLE